MGEANVGTCNEPLTTYDFDFDFFADNMVFS